MSPIDKELRNLVKSLISLRQDDVRIYPHEIADEASERLGARRQLIPEVQRCAELRLRLMAANICRRIEKVPVGDEGLMISLQWRYATPRRKKGDPPSYTLRQYLNGEQIDTILNQGYDASRGRAVRTDNLLLWA